MHPRPREDTTSPSAPSFLCCILVLSSTCRFVLHRIGRLATPHATSLFREPAAAESRWESGCHTRGLDSRSEEHTSELQSPCNLVCRLLLEKKKKKKTHNKYD